MERVPDATCRDPLDKDTGTNREWGIPGQGLPLIDDSSLAKVAPLYSPASRVIGSMTFVFRSTASTIVRCSTPLAALATTGITCR